MSARPVGRDLFERTRSSPVAGRNGAQRRGLTRSGVRLASLVVAERDGRKDRKMVGAEVEADIVPPHCQTG